MKSFCFRSKRWNKIEVGDTFSIFRFIFEDEGHKRFKNLKHHQLPEVGENVMLVSHPPKRQKHTSMGTAEVVGKSAVWVGTSKLTNGVSDEENISNLTNSDAVANGFGSAVDMRKWLANRYGDLAEGNPMYKLTLKKQPIEA